MAGLPLAGIISSDSDYARSAITQIVRGLPGVGRTPRSVELLSCRTSVIWSGLSLGGMRSGWVRRWHNGPFVFFGRLDNRKDLIGALAAEPESSDGALACLAWDRWGDEAPKHLIGGYVIALWDDQRQELVLAVDHTGIETVFYAASTGCFAFAGNPLGLLAAPGVNGQADQEHFAHWMMGRRFLHDRTMYDGVRRIPPGHLARVGPEGVRLSAFWRLGPRQPLRFRRDDDYVAAAREMLDRVVAPHLPENGTLIAELSGGLDTTAVVATAARLAPNCQITSFTTISEPGAPQFTGYAGCTTNDWPNAAAVAARYPNITAHCIEAGGLTPGEIDPTASFMAFGCPIGETSHNGWMARQTAVMKALGPAVLLTGLGGNFTLSEPGFGHLSDLAVSGPWIALMRETLALAKAQGWSAKNTFLTLALLPNLPLAWRQTLRRWRGKTEPPWQNRVPLRPAAVERFGLEQGLAQAGKLRPMELRGGSIPQIVDQLDRYIGKNFRRIWQYRSLGMDVRAPLIDVRMIDFTLSLPRDQFLRQGQTRWLARRVLEDRLPHEVAWDMRHYLVCPEWFHRLTRSKPHWLPELKRLEDSPVARDLLDLPRIQALAAQWPEAPGPEQEGPFREVVARGILAGQFLRWMQRDNC